MEVQARALFAACDCVVSSSLRSSLSLTLTNKEPYLAKGPAAVAITLV